MKKETIRIIILVVGIILVVSGIKIYQNIDKTDKLLKQKGYSEEDIVIIHEKLEDKIDVILNMDYNSNLVTVLKHKYYIPKHLFEYLEFINEKGLDIDTTIGTINTGADKKWYTDTKQVENLSNSMLVNKFNYLSADYAPDDIVSISVMYAYDGHKIKQEVYNQYVKMWKEANKNGLVLIVNSSYRTFAEQEKVYNNSTDEYASHPGFSEHQTGLALDIITYNTDAGSFENSSEFKWLQNNAHKYGFILRYPKGKENITGYNYESWHYRYLGIDLATKVHDSGLTYDEYYAYYCDYKNEC